MKLKLISVAVMVLLLISAIPILSIQPVEAYIGFIYIRSDGTIDPSSAPISTVDGVTFILTADINGAIIIQKDGITLDGQSHILQGTLTETGIEIIGRTNVVIKNLVIRLFRQGIDLGYSSGCIISKNVLSDNNLRGILVRYSSNNYILNNIIINTNMDGIWLRESSNYNTISGNTFENNHNNGIGVSLSSNYNLIYENNILANNIGIEWGINPASNNVLYHNNFIGNTIQTLFHTSASNTWDDNYPSGGNYWSDYTRVDQYQGVAQNVKGSDMIGDSPYVIDALNVDHYPLMTPWTPLPNTISGLKELLMQLASNDQIKTKGALTSLLAKLDNAQKRIEKGDANGAIHHLQTFMVHVQSLTNKQITPTAQYLLITSTENVIIHL